MNNEELLALNPMLFSNENAPLKIILNHRAVRDWESQKQAYLQTKDLPSVWAEIGVVLDDPYFMVIRDLVEFPDGSRNGYSRIVGNPRHRRGPGVAVLPVLGNKVVLLHQFRHPTRSWHYEIPRGFGEPETSAAENAYKEINEELEGKIANLTELGDFHSNTGLESSVVSLFLATLESYGQPNAAEGITEVLPIEVATLEDWIRAGKITDGFTIAAYTRARLAGLL